MCGCIISKLTRTILSYVNLLKDRMDHIGGEGDGGGREKICLADMGTFSLLTFDFTQIAINLIS